MTLRLFSAGRTEVRIHPLAVAALIGACVLGRLDALLMAMLALTLHEAAHVVVAGVFGCEIHSVELQPFGGVARMHDPGLTAHAEWCIASAGPVASFIIAGVTSMAGYYAPAVGARIEPFLTFNLALGTVNLLPALPLDGGRVVRSALAGRFSASLALRATAWAGILCGAGMLAAAAVAMHSRVFNPTLPVMGLFLLIAAIRELRSSQEQHLAAFFHKNDALRCGDGMEMHLIAAHDSMRCAEALRLLRANRFNLIRVVDSGMHTLGELDEGALMRGLARMGAGARIGEILSFDRMQRL